MTMPVPEHVAITGATGGIGRALAKQFAEAGYRVSAIARDAAKLESLSTSHPRIKSFVADVADPQSCSRALATAAEDNGPVDALIANAAIYPQGFFVDQPAEVFSATLRVNIEGVANSIRPVLPGMLERNLGRIVVMGSLTDIGAPAGSSAYSVSKGAIHPLVRTIAREIDRERYPNVLINEFSPGATRTAMSSFGHDPEDIFPMLIDLIRCGPTGPQGRFFQEGRQLHIGESWKGTLKRIILRK